MALNVSAFSLVRNNSTSSEDSDAKTAIHFPKPEPSYNVPAFIPWWNAESSGIVKQPLWSWWGLQNQRLSNLYRFPQYAGATDDEKPTQSYIGLIAEAILSCPEEQLILSDIYGFILANYPYFRNKGTGWRNSIRHNLSLNDCFIKAGRSQNGKGHFWAISHLYLDDFRRGDFRRKRTYRRPSRGRRAKAKLEALKTKTRCQDTLEESKKSELIVNVNETTVPEKQLALNTEQFDNNIMDDTDVVKTHEEEQYIETENLCDEQKEQKANVTHESIVPSYPEYQPEEYYQVDVCKKEYEKEPTKNYEQEENEHTKMVDEIRAGRPFDMATILAPERTTKDLGILREMYPMYYNIMNLGMRTLDSSDCYGASSAYCGHCRSMLGPFHSHHTELGRPVYTMAPYGTGQFKNEGNRREHME